MFQFSHLGVTSSVSLEPHNPFIFLLGLVHPKWLKHDDTPSLVHFPERGVFLGRRQRWAKHLLVLLLCSQETKEVSLPYNWLAAALIIQYVKNLQVGAFDGVFQNQP